MDVVRPAVGMGAHVGGLEHDQRVLLGDRAGPLVGVEDLDAEDPLPQRARYVTSAP